MKLLISDANILIDMEAGDLLPSLFKLPFQIGIPDILYYEEIAPADPILELQGLNIMEVSGEFVQYAIELPIRYSTLPKRGKARPSSNDCLALALAKQESATLLTGDQNLKILAEAENVPVKGTIWLLSEMLTHHICSRQEISNALDKMQI